MFALQLARGKFWDHYQREWVDWDPKCALMLEDVAVGKKEHTVVPTPGGLTDEDMPNDGANFDSADLFAVLGVSRDVSADNLRRFSSNPTPPPTPSLR